MRPGVRRIAAASVDGNQRLHAAAGKSKMAQARGRCRSRQPLPIVHASRHIFATVVIAAACIRNNRRLVLIS